MFWYRSQLQTKERKRYIIPNISHIPLWIEYWTL